MDADSGTPLDRIAEGTVVLVPAIVQGLTSYSFIDLHIIEGECGRPARIYAPEKVMTYPAPEPPELEPAACSQCGQRTPVCGEPDCNESIIFVPKSGFGMQGEWRHLAPPKVHTRSHEARPKVFVS